MKPRRDSSVRGGKSHSVWSKQEENTHAGAPPPGQIQNMDHMSSVLACVGFAQGTGFCLTWLETLMGLAAEFGSRKRSWAAHESRGSSGRCQGKQGLKKGQEVLKLPAREICVGLPLCESGSQTLGEVVVFSNAKLPGKKITRLTNKKGKQTNQRSPK